MASTAPQRRTPARKAGTNGKPVRKAATNGKAPARKATTNGKATANASGTRKATPSGKAARKVATAGKATARKDTANAKPVRKAAARAKDSSGTGSELFRATTKRAAKPGGGVASTLARKVAAKAAKAFARRTLGTTAKLARAAAERTIDSGRRALDTGFERRLPIQVGVDVAVPVSFAWEEWMALESLCEGVDRIEGVERDGDELTGHIAGPRSRDWAAEIVDERPEQSFAWRSFEGSDCAGLVTFHAISERLTRIEVDLDVVPTGPAQTLSFASHLAHRRVEAEMRRFKARLEFVNPDVYEPDEEAPEEASEEGEQTPDEDTTDD